MEASGLPPSLLEAGLHQVLHLARPGNLVLAIFDLLPDIVAQDLQMMFEH